MVRSLSQPPGLSNRVRTTVAGLIIIGAVAGLSTEFRKNTPTGESASEDIHCFTSTGASSVCFSETGTVNASGSVIAQVALSGAIVHSLTGAIFGDSDGGGCSAIYVLNGVVSASTTDCP